MHISRRNMHIAIESILPLTHKTVFFQTCHLRLILDTYRSDQFMIVKSVGEHQPSLSPSPKLFVRFSLPPGS